MSKESKMEPLEKTWILELVGTAMLAALLALWGWTANKVVQNGESIIEVKAELQQELGEEIAEVRVELGEEIAEVRVELGREIAAVNAKIAANGEKIAAMDAKLDLLISGLNIAVAPKDNAGAGPAGAKRGGLRVGA
ncbi:MAG: hypothetical protein OXU61_10465, partial [Gammaproteobacteria bacterium]|nr:hypothetical protein [Gammaproteobacteria bacterium]